MWSREIELNGTLLKKYVPLEAIKSETIHKIKTSKINEKLREKKNKIIQLTTTTTQIFLNHENSSEYQFYIAIYFTSFSFSPSLHVFIQFEASQTQKQTKNLKIVTCRNELSWAELCWNWASDVHNNFLISIAIFFRFFIFALSDSFVSTIKFTVFLFRREIQFGKYRKAAAAAHKKKYQKQNKFHFVNLHVCVCVCLHDGLNRKITFLYRFVLFLVRYIFVDSTLRCVFDAGKTKNVFFFGILYLFFFMPGFFLCFEAYFFFFCCLPLTRFINVGELFATRIFLMFGKRNRKKKNEWVNEKH